MDKRDNPATSTQVRKITQLASALRIKEPLEEKKMTIGEAGKLIKTLSGRLTALKLSGKTQTRKCRLCGSTLLNDFSGGYCLLHGTMSGR